MQAFVLGILCLCLAGSTWAGKPVPCTSPPLLTGSFSSTAGDGQLASYGKYEYDALGKQFRLFQMGMYNNGSFTMDLLMLFNKGVIYEIDWSTFSCKKSALTTPFHPMEVPRDATFMGQVVMGTSSALGQGMLVNTWYGHDVLTNASYMTVFSGIGCIPLTVSYHTPEMGWSFVSYFNTLLGIADPQNFFPPWFCEYAELEGTVDFFSAITGKGMM